MQNTVAAKNVRFIPVEVNKVIKGEIVIVKKIKAVIKINGEKIKYVTTDGREKETDEVSFFADNMWRMMYEMGAGAYLSHLESKASEEGFNLDTVYGNLLTHFEYSIDVQEGKIDLLEMIPDDKVKNGIAKYSKKLDDMLD